VTAHDEHRGGDAGDHDTRRCREEEPVRADRAHAPVLGRSAEVLTRDAVERGARDALVRNVGVECTVSVPRRVASSERAKPVPMATLNAATASGTHSMRMPSDRSEGNRLGRTFGKLAISCRTQRARDLQSS
jgi:hypothetical protein